MHHLRVLGLREKLAKIREELSCSKLKKYTRQPTCLIFELILKGDTGDHTIWSRVKYSLTFKKKCKIPQKVGIAWRDDSGWLNHQLLWNQNTSSLVRLLCLQTCLKKNIEIQMRQKNTFIIYIVPSIIYIICHKCYTFILHIEFFFLHSHKKRKHIHILSDFSIHLNHNLFLFFFTFYIFFLVAIERYFHSCFVFLYTMNI